MGRFCIFSREKVIFVNRKMRTMPYDNSAVRRQDRLLDEARARELLAGGRFGVLSLVDGDGAYGIPVNYVWDGDDSLYVHCAPDGRKLRCIDRRDRVSFCVVGATEVCPAQFTTAYESIVLDLSLIHIWIFRVFSVTGATSRAMFSLPRTTMNSNCRKWSLVGALKAADRIFSSTSSVTILSEKSRMVLLLSNTS